MNENEFIKITYPAVRQFTADTGRIDHEKHFVRGLLEVDLTTALQKIRALRAPGRKVSVQAWFISVLAAAVADHPPINGIKKGRHQVVVFKNVDVATVVEKKVGEVSIPLPLVLRDANHRSMFELNAEIQAAVEKQVNANRDVTLGKDQDPLAIRLAALLPQWLRLWFMRAFILSNPQRMQNMMGTVMVTSLGTVSHLSGWIMPSSLHSLSVGIGSLNKKPVIVNGAVEIRNILHLTIGFDHDVIDGMPAMRFVDDLVSRLEAGAGLEDPSAGA